MINHDNLDVLKRVWQNQKSLPVPPSKLESILDDIKIRLSQYEKSQWRVNLIKSIAIGFISIAFIWFLFSRHHPGVFAFSGLSIIFVSMAVFIRQYWSKQFSLSALDFSLSQREFIREAICQINRQYEFFKKYFAYYVATLILGINVLYYEILKDAILLDNWEYHMVATIVLMMMIPLGLKIRTFKFNRENKPLLDYLKNLDIEAIGDE